MMIFKIGQTPPEAEADPIGTEVSNIERLLQEMEHQQSTGLSCIECLT